MANSDPERDIEILWRKGDPLDVAADKFAPQTLRDQLRSAKTAGALKSIQFLMSGYLRDALANAELVAIGISYEPQLEAAPSRIPPFLFALDDAEFDLGNSEFSGGGRTFKSVRIAPSQQATSADKINAPKPGNANEPHGRYPEAKRILHQLFAEQPILESASAGKLLHRFNERLHSEYERAGLKYAPISERSLRDYLKRYRQESASSGKE